MEKPEQEQLRLALMRCRTGGMGRIGGLGIGANGVFGGCEVKEKVPLE